MDAVTIVLPNVALAHGAPIKNGPRLIVPRDVASGFDCLHGVPAAPYSTPRAYQLSADAGREEP